MRSSDDRLSLDPSGRFFRQSGRPVFLLADTMWAAFSRMDENEWHTTLRLRRRQQFNAVAISVLPIIRDRSISPNDRLPFAVRPDGSWNYGRPDRSYFQRARRMVQVARDAGVVPILAALWCTYVPGSWGSRNAPQFAMNDDQLAALFDLIVETFGDLDPIVSVTGDEHIAGETGQQRYQPLVTRLREQAPHLLLGLHSNPATRPEEAPMLHAAMDLHVFQSGHDTDWLGRAAELPTCYTALEPARPVLALEPCYEAHAYAGRTARHDARDVRRASWTSLLAGAGAGLGYGAHGVWMWHRAGDTFTSADWSGTPLPASEALRLRGAWDVGLLRRLVERHQLHALWPRQDLLPDGSVARLGLTADGMRGALYAPHPMPIDLALDLTGWEIEMWDLEERRLDHAGTQAASPTTFDLPDVAGDVVYLFRQPESAG